MKIRDLKRKSGETHVSVWAKGWTSTPSLWTPHEAASRTPPAHIGVTTKRALDQLFE